MMCMIRFFMSSRRRHTRWPRDWSSDVCSSDLLVRIDLAFSKCFYNNRACLFFIFYYYFFFFHFSCNRNGSIKIIPLSSSREIGRASCRERVCVGVGVVTLANKRKENGDEV